MTKEDLEQIKETIYFALINARFKEDNGKLFHQKAITSLDKIEKQLSIYSVVVSEACKCEKPLPYELMPFKCHNCKGEIKKSETEFCEHPIRECRTLNDELKFCNLCGKVIDKQN